MINNPYLDTVISLVLVYATLSIVVSMLLEWINKLLRERGLFLQRAIGRMIDDPNNLPFGHIIYAHPLIARLRKDAKALPSYISGNSFATALTDLMGERGWTLKSEDAGNGLYRWVKNDQAEDLAKRFHQAVLGLADSQLKTVLLGMADRSTMNGVIDLNALRANIARWYDDHMDRLGGEYKDEQRVKLFILGFVVAFALNVDSIHLVRVFFLNEPLRTSMVQRAEDVADRYAQLTEEQRRDWHQQLSVIATLKADTVKRDSLFKANTDTMFARINRFLVDTEEAKARVHTMDSITSAIAQWGLPVGYANDEPPMVWFRDTPKITERKALLKKEPLLRYYHERGEHCGLYLFLWLMGTSLTGLALSAGAPFWFATLTKLINIRRAGAKPSRADEAKANS